MNHGEHKPKPRTRRTLVIAVLLVAALILLFANHTRRQLAVEILKNEIIAAGGSVYLADPFLVRLGAKWRRQPYEEHTSVVLEGQAFDASWLQEHDDLRDICISSLAVFDCPLDGRDLARLAAQHPLISVETEKMHNSDELARALGDHRDLYLLDLPDCDLSDAGFSYLPLGHLRQLCIDGTKVTADSLKRLENSRLLECLGIDGNQFNGEVRDLILGLRDRTFVLNLCGPSVTDRHIAFVRELGVANCIGSVNFFETSVSAQPIKDLKAELPPHTVGY